MVPDRAERSFLFLPFDAEKAGLGGIFGFFGDVGRVSAVQQRVRLLVVFVQPGKTGFRHLAARVRRGDDAAIAAVDQIDIIEKALQRLEAIDNANPSEVLEFLETIKTTKELKPFLEQTKQYILKAQEMKKVLKVIFEKNVDIYLLNDLGTLEEYNEWVLKKYGTYYQQTQEEFDLVKRYCNENKGE